MSHDKGEKMSPIIDGDDVDDTPDDDVWVAAAAAAAAAAMRAQQRDCWRQVWCHKDMSTKQRWMSPSSVLPLKISTSQ